MNRSGPWKRGTTAILTPLLLAVVACGSGEEASNEATTTGDAASAFTAPLGTDILLAPLQWTGDVPEVGAPTNLTRRPGYDNQPAFTPDGSGLWYTAVDEHDGQADIWRIDFEPAGVARVTSTAPESEYSATSLPDRSGISTIRVEADSTQRLWRFDADGSNGAVLLPDVAPVGYHAWSGSSRLVMFVLGDPPTLRIADLGGGEARVVAEDIGRSIQPIPGGDDVSFVQRHPDGSATVMRVPANGGPPVPVIDVVEGGDDHAWAPNGTLLMASGSVLWARPPGGDGWQQVADFTDLTIDLTRLAVSPDGSQIAMVAEVTPIDPIGG